MLELIAAGRLNVPVQGRLRALLNRRASGRPGPAEGWGLDLRAVLVIEEFLFSISEALLWPVLVAAILGLAWAIVETGILIAELWRRRWRLFFLCLCRLSFFR